MDKEELIRRAIKLATLARCNGNDPFGALLAGSDGRIVLEAENEVPRVS